MRVQVESDAISSAVRGVHDISLAALIGGNLFGRVAMHPAVGLVTEARERGRVVNRAWQRYGVVNSLALAGLLATWTPARFADADDALLSEQERSLTRAKDLVMCAVAVTGIASAVEGVRFARMESGGAIPLEDGSHPAAEAPEREAKAKRRLNVLGGAHLAATLALAGINAALSQASFRRPPKRRLLKRRY
jgi:hypothetical protein